ncbi:MAG TPA: hypothetical protein PKK43_12725, partial [Spirochaetota bacterium]|nr:hypothetical protein [Spirochaetota bacterium]
GSVSLYWFRIHMNPRARMNLKISYKTIIGYDDSFKYTYILKTGKYWKGQIGKSVVRIRTAYPARKSGYLFSPQISGIAEDGEVEFVFKDFEPNFDINVEFKPDGK